MFVVTTLEKMTAQRMKQTFVMAPNQSLTQFLSIPPDSEYEIEKRIFSNRLHLDREQVLLAMPTRYQNLQRQRRKSGARRNAVHVFLADTGNEKFDGKRYYPSGSRGRGRGMGRGKNRGRGRGEQGQRIGGDKSDGTKDGNGKVDSSSSNVKYKRCGDDEHKAVRCPGQLCGVCGGKGHAAEICANADSCSAHTDRLK